MKRAYSAKLSRDAREYLSAHDSRWCSGTRKDLEKRLRQLETWLRRRRLKLCRLDAVALAEYCGQPVDAAPACRKLVLLRDYLIWCHARSIRSPDPRKLFPEYLARRPYVLPPLLKEYIDSIAKRWNPNSVQQARLSVSYFHRAMIARDLGLRDLTREHVEAVLAEVEETRAWRPISRKNFRASVRRYLDWLRDRREVADLDLEGIVPLARHRHLDALTPPAQEYLKFLPAVVKPNTWKIHQSALGRFHRHLFRHSIDAGRLTRADLEGWLRTLVDANLAPMTRHQYIRIVRLYLGWLYQHGYLERDPEELLQIGDIPKKPRLLPRPIPPDLDREMQRRLRASDRIEHGAILLLRRTGMRVGELIKMPMDCVRIDPDGTTYLKVPLGKMNNERLVPLDSETLAIVRRIQDQSNSLRGGNLLQPAAVLRLVHGPDHPNTCYQWLRHAFVELLRDLPSPERVHLHRLRHTFATEMLNAGVSLYGVMHLLGHRHAGTTLVYAAIVQATVYEEYFAAMEKLKAKYVEASIMMRGEPADLTPTALVDDLARSLKRLRGSAEPEAQKRIRLLLKKLDHLRADLGQIT